MKGFPKSHETPGGFDGAPPSRAGPPELSATPQEIARAVRAKAHPLLVARLRAIFWLLLASLAIFFVADLVSARDRVTPLLIIKGAQVVVVLAAFSALRQPPVRHVARLAVLVFGLVAILAAASAVIRENAAATMGLYVVFTIGGAMTLPWGVGPQAAIVAFVTATLGWSLWAVDGTLAGIVSPATGTVLTAGLVSIYLARDSERYRYQLEEREIGLRKREEHFRALIEHGSDLILVADANGSIRYVSPSLQRILGYEPALWIGGALTDHIHPDDLPFFREAMARGRQAVGPARPLEIRIRDERGAWHVFDGALTDLLDNTAVRGFVLNARDISRRKQAETELRRSEAALSALIESTTDSVWSIDRQRRFVVMNSAVRQAMGAYGAVAHPGQRFEDRAPPDLIRTWRALYDRVLAGERVTTEQSFEHEGALRHYLISMCPIVEDGEIIGATIFSRDITDLRETETMARRNHTELTHALRLATIGEISSALAHEINQPLGAITNYASACVRRIDSGSISTQEIRRGLDLIAEEALRAGEIIRGIRDLGRKGDGELSRHDLNDIVRRAVLVAEPEARVQRIALRVETAERLPQIYGDAVQLQQVLLNLILNGIEAMHSSSEKSLSIRTAACGDGVEVAVSDTGHPFDAALREAIFEPFFTTKPKGLGMGLAISRRIVEAHGGALSARVNDDGRGSTFSFTLPERP